MVSASYTGGSPESQGLSADKFRAQYQQHGEPIRWWKGYLTAAGTRNFVEQTLADTNLVLVYNTTREFVDIESGVTIQKGATGISVLNDEIELCHGDRIVLIHTKRAKLRRGNFRRKGSTDALPYSPVQSIVRVVNAAGTELVDGTDFQAADGGIEWLNNTLAVGSSYAIEWRAWPSYLVNVQEERDSPIGTDGELLPLRWILEAEKTRG